MRAKVTHARKKNLYFIQCDENFDQNRWIFVLTIVFQNQLEPLITGVIRCHMYTMFITAGWGQMTRQQSAPWVKTGINLKPE